VIIRGDHILIHETNWHVYITYRCAHGRLHAPNSTEAEDPFIPRPRFIPGDRSLTCVQIFGSGYRKHNCATYPRREKQQTFSKQPGRLIIYFYAAYTHRELTTGNYHVRTCHRYWKTGEIRPARLACERCGSKEGEGWYRSNDPVDENLIGRYTRNVQECVEKKGGGDVSNSM